MRSIRKYVFHILYVLTLTQYGGGPDFRVTAIPLLEECDPTTLEWTVTPSTAFVVEPGGASIKLVNPTPGPYEVQAIDVHTCQALSTVTVPPPPSATFGRGGIIKAPHPTR